jgi:hypothetical protein
MTLEAAFGDLRLQLQKLREVLVGLRITVVEDRPLEDEAMLVDDFGDMVTDLLAWLEKASTAAGEGRQALSPPMNMDRARRALAVCHEWFNRTAHRLSSDLMSYERIAELAHLIERGGEWPIWARSVKEGLDRCQQPLYDVNQALFRCWQEIAERAGMTSVAVQTTSIGQQITTPAERDTEREVII